jgi:hypothetical protein
MIFVMLAAVTGNQSHSEPLFFHVGPIKLVVIFPDPADARANMRSE